MGGAQTLSQKAQTMKTDELAGNVRSRYPQFGQSRIRGVGSHSLSITDGIDHSAAAIRDVVATR